MCIRLKARYDVLAESTNRRNRDGGKSDRNELLQQAILVPNKRTAEYYYRRCMPETNRVNRVADARQFGSKILY